MDAAATLPRSGHLFRQLLWSTLVVLLPTLGLLAFHYYVQTRDAKEELNRLGTEQAYEAARNTDRALTRVDSVLNFLLTREEVQTLDVARCNTLLAGFYSMDLLLRNVVVLDAKGRTVCAARWKSNLPTSAAAFPWYSAALQADGRRMSEPYTRSNDGEPGLVLTDIVRDKHGRRVGMVVAAFDIEAVADRLLRVADLPPGSMLALVDKAGRLMARNPDSNKYFAAQTPQSPHHSLKLPNETPVYLGLDKVLRVRTATVPLESAPWRLHVGVPVSHLQASANAFAWNGLAVLLLSGLACFFVAWWNARRIAAPAQELATAARRLGQGDRGARADASLPGEFGHVAREFNAMADALEGLEANRIETVRIRAASQAKTEFLARMSHELRTPLNAVLGFTQLLRESTGAVLSAQQTEQLATVGLAGQQLSALIDDVLDLARIESGHLAVHLEATDLAGLLRTALHMCESQAAGAKVRLVQGLDTEGGPAFRVHTDPLRLQQVVLNLLSNAIKYNREGGEVRVSLQATEQEVLLTVADTGLGMTPDQVAHAFEPFNRLGRQTSGIPGTGIGLALTRQLVDLLGAQLELSSAEGQGTTVRVTLPRLAAPAEPVRQAASSVPAEAAHPQDSSPQRTVLYIEDVPMNVVLVEALLAPMPGVTLVAAETGAIGLELARTLRPSLVLLDMHLPDMTGIEVLEQLRTLELLQDTPIIALSASAMPDEVALACAAGASDYWSKPIRFEQFRTGVREWLAPGRGVTKVACKEEEALAV